MEIGWYIVDCPMKEKEGICDIGNEFSDYVHGQQFLTMGETISVS
jgi:hypothetical protein